MSQKLLVIEVKVKPNAGASQLHQEEPGRWLAQLKSPPVEGKANVSIKTGSSGRLRLVKISASSPLPVTAPPPRQIRATWHHWLQRPP